MKKQFSHATLHRLPEYCRILRELLGEEMLRVSSAVLAKRMGISAPQVRQDLGGFPGCGIRGYGYATPKLYQAVCACLGIADEFSAVILGDAQAAELAKFPLFSRYGIRLRGIFSTEPSQALTPSQIRIYPCSEWQDFCQREKIRLLILCSAPEDAAVLPAAAAQAGIRGILNLSDHPIPAEYGIIVRNLSISAELMLLCHALKQEEIRK